MTTLQTLDRGLAALALIADSAGLSVQALADALGVHKAIAYRIVATLEGHGLVARAPDGRVTLGAGTLALSARFAPHFQTEAGRVLADLSRATGCTACIAVAEGDTCVVSQVHEAEAGFMRLSYRVGVRHPLTLGATGLAILAGRAAQPGESPDVTQGRRKGYVVTQGQLEAGVTGLARPVLRPGEARAGIEPCIAVARLGTLDLSAAVAATERSVEVLRGLLVAAR